MSFTTNDLMAETTDDSPIESSTLPVSGKPTPPPPPKPRTIKRPPKIPASSIKKQEPIILPGSLASQEFIRSRGYDIRSGEPTFKLAEQHANLLEPPLQLIQGEPEEPRISARQRPGELLDEVLKRQQQLDIGQDSLKLQKRTLAAQTRAQLAPQRGLSAYTNAAARGFQAPLEGLLNLASIISKDPSLQTAAEGDWGERNFPLPVEQSLGQKVVGGVASSVPFMLAGVAGGSSAVSALGALSNAGQLYREAKNRGADERTAMVAAFDGLPVGALEGLLGVEAIGLKGLTKTTLGNLLKEPGEEFIQEGLSQLLNNVIAKTTAGYDPERAILEGVIENASLGALTGGIISTPFVPGAIRSSKIEALKQRGHDMALSKLLPGEASPPNVEFSVGKLPTQDSQGETLYSGFPKSGVQEGQKLFTNPAFDPDMWKQMLAGKQPTAFTKADLQTMEQRSLASGRLIALTPETHDEFVSQAEALKEQLVTMDPTSPEFEDIARQQIALAIAVTDADPESLLHITDTGSLEDHLLQSNLGHTGAVDEIMQILQPELTQKAARMPAMITTNDLDSEEETAPQLEVDPKRLKLSIPTDTTKGLTLFVPGDVFTAAGFYSSSFRSQEKRPFLGLTVSTDRIDVIIKKLRSTLPLPVSSEIEIQLRRAATISEQRGIYAIPLINRDADFGTIRGTIRHEKWHVGQTTAAITTQPFDASIMRDTLLDIHDPDFAASHPTIAKVAQTPFGQALLNYYGGSMDGLAAELPAFVAGGQHQELGLTSGEAVDFLLDYLDNIVLRRGLDALRAFERAAGPRPAIKEIINVARAKFDPLGGAIVGGNIVERPELSSSGQGTGASSGRVYLAANSGSRAGQGAPAAPNPGSPTSPPTGASSAHDPDEPFYQEVLNLTYTREITDQFKILLGTNGITWDPTTPTFVQIQRAITSGAIPADRIVDQMRAEGIPPSALGDIFLETASLSGKQLNALSQVERFWDQLYRTDPALAKQLIPPSYEAKLLLKDLQASILGRDLWRRSGDLLRKMALSDQAIAAINFLSTSARLPMAFMDGAFKGYALGLINPGKYKGMDPTSIAGEAQNSTLNSMKPAIEVIMRLTPRALRGLMNRTDPTLGSKIFEDSIISHLEDLHPELHAKLTGLSSGLEELGQVSASVSYLRSLLVHIPDIGQRQKIETQVEELEKRDRFNKTLAGKAFRGTEFIYDQLLRPNMWQEFLFRRPFFVGALREHMAVEGLDLSEVVANGTFNQVSKEAISKAIDQALEFTYAYQPHTDRGHIEKAAAKGIEMINALGPIGFMISGFPRAVYNGAKFWYEYSPLGGIKPGANLLHDLAKKGRTGIEERDIERLAHAAVGTIMYVAAHTLVNNGGTADEWWKVRVPGTGKKGRPLYLNVRRLMPFAGFLFMADAEKRLHEGRTTDKQLVKEWSQLYLGMRGAEQGSSIFLSTAQAMADYWDDARPDNSATTKGVAEQAGQFFALPLTPLKNVRDIIAQFDRDQNVKKDVNERPFLGPSLERLPWFRNRLPDQVTMTQQAPIQLSALPGLTPIGINLQEQPSFASTEFSRLGLNPTRWLHRDPDPLIDRAQNSEMARMLDQLSIEIVNNPAYKAMDNPHKSAYWESLMLDQGEISGLVSLAKEVGEQANPIEMAKRAIKKGYHPLERRALSIDKQLEKLGQSK